MHIIHLPIEPFPQRYSEDWLQWYREYGEDSGDDEHTFILGNQGYRKITHGSFLDVTGTLLFKNSQMYEVIAWINSRINTQDWAKTVFFFHDLWHPGVTDLFYVRDGLELPFKIVGSLHAGTYDPWDFLAQQGMGQWAHSIEFTWFTNVDRIFVATNFHKSLLSQTRVPSWGLDTVKVTGFPIYPRTTIHQATTCLKNLDIVFPHRLNPEKQPDLFDDFACKNRDYICDKTLNLSLTKKEYYQQLCKYKVAVSYALQETWGIAMQECVFAGCFPFVPDRLSYSEMYPTCFKYAEDERESRLLYLLKNWKNTELQQSWTDLYNALVKAGQEAIPNQIEEMRLLCQ